MKQSSYGWLGIVQQDNMSERQADEKGKTSTDMEHGQTQEEYTMLFIPAAKEKKM